MNQIKLSERGSALYLSEKDRFRGTFVQEERLRREESLVRKKKDLERRRLLNESLGEQRRKNEEEKALKEQKRLDALQMKGSPKNEGSLPYNPLTLEYDCTFEGKMLEFEDDKIKYRAKLRARKLYYEQNRNGYNPITGECCPEEKTPDKPEEPSRVKVV